MNQSLLIVLLCVACTAPSPPHRVAPSLQSVFTDTMQSPAQRLAAGTQLLQLTDGAAFLAQQNHSGSRALIRALLDTLEIANPPQAASLAAHLLETVQGEEKIDIEEVLLRQEKHAVSPLLELLSRNPDWQTQMQALDALGKLGAPESVDSVAKKLNAPNTWVRLAAAHALGELGGEKAVSALIRALNDTTTVTAAALIGLGRTGNNRAIAPCTTHLSHSNPRVRAAAASALGRLNAPESIPHLEPLLQDPDEGVRYKARQALDALRHP
ncbi:MAG: HEAT repeat domain-containing protein [bacterium]|nr:HEAT repeat domain-containing protein [bacterium]